MGRLTLHYIEEVLRRIINDPQTSTEERRKAANQLQKAQDRARAARKARQKATEPSQTRSEAIKSGPATGWQIDWEEPMDGYSRREFSPYERAAWRALWALEVARGQSEHNWDTSGGCLTEWEKAQGKLIASGELKPVLYLRQSAPDKLAASLEELPPPVDEFDCDHQIYPPLPEVSQ